MDNHKPNYVIKPQISYVLISICTCKRPKMLRNSLLSINQLVIPENFKVEVLITDNDPEASARSTVDEFKEEFNGNVHYFIEPERGISNARNRVLQEAINLGASHILFFDDDELLDKNCLAEHTNFYNSNPNAYIISGPTPNIFKEKYPSYITKHMVFKQRTSKKTGQILTECAAGNVFFPVCIAKEYGLRFSEEYKYMGGEDGQFFNKAYEIGFTIVWNNNAIIYEVVPPARANISYILKKCYYNGYAGAYRKLKDNKSKFKKIIYIIKSCFVLFINILLCIPSIILGLTVFFNVMGVCFKTKGKIDSMINNTTYNFYEKIYGE